MTRATLPVPFGARVEYSAVLARRWKFPGLGHDILKFWHTVILRDARSGLFLGLRTVSDGERYCDDDGCYYTPRKYHRVALVCPGPGRNPVYVPLECLRAVESVK